MNKLQYRSSEAPTPWGIVNVPERPFIKGLPQNCSINCSITSCVCSNEKGITYSEALELALKNWVPIRVEDQEKVSFKMLYETDESKLYDLGEIEVILGRDCKQQICSKNECNCKYVYMLTSKVKEVHNEELWNEALTNVPVRIHELTEEFLKKNYRISKI